jgi:Ca2+-binding RTX toxin-like protein
MAKVNFYNALGAGEFVGDFYTDEFLGLSEASTNQRAIYEDLEQNTDLIFKGTGIKYSEGHMVKGTIEQIVFVNGDGDVMYKVTGLEENAFGLSEMMGSEFSIDNILDHVLRGKDTITGSDLGDEMFFDKGNDNIDGGKGNDIIAGGRGLDILTGGKGSDFFIVNEASSHDTITDFHAGGGDGVQDLLFGNMDIVTLTKKGDDLLVKYDEAPVSFLLEGIKKSQIDASDFGGFPLV